MAVLIPLDTCSLSDNDVILYETRVGSISNAFSAANSYPAVISVGVRPY